VLSRELTISSRYSQLRCSDISSPLTTAGETALVGVEGGTARAGRDVRTGMCEKRDKPRSYRFPSFKMETVYPPGGTDGERTKRHRWLPETAPTRSEIERHPVPSPHVHSTLHLPNAHPTQGQEPMFIDERYTQGRVAMTHV
jgi:hypothetical protein